MKPVTQTRTRTFSLILSPYLLIACVFAVGVTTVSAKTLAGYTAAPPNPFAAYADILPGQPRSAAVERGFSCPVSFFFGNAPSDTDEMCILNPAAGKFQQVQVSIARGVIGQARFIMREDSLKLGDLTILWGVPQVYELDHSLYFAWPGMGVTASSLRHLGRVSPFFSTRIVSFSDTNQGVGLALS